MSTPPDGWTLIKGVSCAGWDIWAGKCERGGRSPYAVLRRRIADQDTYDIGKRHPSLESVTAAIDEIRQTLREGKYRFDDLFPEEKLIDHPNYGAF
ncbi:hypothetical protein SAMN05216358_0065 [Rhizobium sp. AN5]|uniref:hypothetical protein n=1 Tax=Rhizobium sp. AN5 TaxID=1855304 RepID=UPI000BDCA6A6|nr:hypothetical protein [Rhizobium sp. AN5]SOC90046.1 hypothetical protein SAMN05216358_0065 [Rhizobium sp. AN5]